MDELKKGKNKIRTEAKKATKESVDDMKSEIKENYKIGIEYYQDINKYEK